MENPLVQIASKVDVLDHSTTAYKPLPEIYQIEICSACDLQCPMCLRTTETQKRSGLVKMELLRMMHDRGDFEGSTFVELQQAGEPTLHPHFSEIVHFLKDKVKVLVGTSTHGLKIASCPLIKVAMMRLDALTISVDSVQPDVYHKMRYPATLDQLVKSLDSFFRFAGAVKAQRGHLPFIELQLVKTPLVEGSGVVEALITLAGEHGWLEYASVRTTQDSFMEMDGRLAPGTMQRPGNGQVCQNPFSSVSVHHNGDVVSCCYIFNPNSSNKANWYGNLYSESLADIWNGRLVEHFRHRHTLRLLHGTECEKCYYWSPVQIHQNILRRLVRSR